MTPPTAMEVMRLAQSGLGHEDIVVKLKDKLDERDRKEVRCFVLRLSLARKRAI